MVLHENGGPYLAPAVRQAALHHRGPTHVLARQATTRLRVAQERVIRPTIRQALRQTAILCV